jgi:hypothetical protein
MRYPDPILEEIHEVREALAKEADYDLEKLARALDERQAKGGRKVVSLPPRRVAPVKKAS